MDKESRKHDIRKIISSRKISGQEELLEALTKFGYDITQATLSRDLKDLGVAKIPDKEKGYVYILPDEIGKLGRVVATMNNPGESIVSMEFSYHFCIIRTLPGFANSVAIYIDSVKDTAISGTIAGDDTVLIIPREPATRVELKTAMQKCFPTISTE
jgi:transcriptional regulator of arginine metabolism